MVVFLDLGLESRPEPVSVVKSTGTVASVETRNMLCKRVRYSLVEGELNSLLDAEASASSVQGRHEVVIHNHTSEGQHVRLGGLNAGITVLLSPEVGDIVNLAKNSNPESILIFCMASNLLNVPCLVGVGTQKLSETDNPKDNQAVKKEDNEEQDELFTPSHTDIRSSHASNKLEKRLDVEHALCLPPRTLADPDSLLANKDFAVAPASLEHPSLDTVLAILTAYRDFCYDGWPIQEDAKNGAVGKWVDLDTILNHLSVNAQSVVENGSHGQSPAESGFGDFNNSDGNGVTILVFVWSADATTINRLIAISDTEHLSGNGSVGLGNDPVNESFIQASNKCSSILSAQLLHENLGLHTKKTADIFADLLEIVGIGIVVESVAKLEKSSQGRDEVTVDRSLDTNLLECLAKVVGSGTIIGGDEHGIQPRQER
ncbi:hypothetical protein HG531_009773 [Fusarium graminearum]|nr:hypothetical protein HG531_009773 [Fusarium graminearum]